MHVGHGRWGSSPTRNTPWTYSPATKVPHPLEDLTGDLTGEGIGAVSVEKLGAATTHLLTEWLTGHAATGGKVWTSPTARQYDVTPVSRRPPPRRT